MTNNPLLGKTITAVYLADDQQAIRFDCGEDRLVVGVDADCCSYTWIENVQNPEALIGSPVLTAKDIPMPDLGDLPGKEVVAYYGFKIETLNGTCVLDYRNDSNGYYGGSLTWPGDYHYGGVFGQNNSKEEWKLIAGTPLASSTPA